MTGERLAADEARAELYEIMATDLPFEEKATRALELGESYLGVDNAHLARIDERTDFWEAVASSDSPAGRFPPGLTLDYQTTYCRRVVDRGSSIALYDAPTQGWADDPAFETHGLHCYHGTPIRVDGDLYGTVCFVSAEPRAEPFTESETLFAELIGRMLEHELKRNRDQAELDLRAGLVQVLSRVLRHNIRNDLSVIRAALERDNPEEDGVEAAALESIDDLVALAGTARDIESTLGEAPEERPVELTALVRQIFERVRRDHPDASFTLDAPDTVGAITAFPSLRTGLAELVENAAKHAGPDAAVTVSITSGDSEVVIEISDDGPGLPEQERAVLEAGTESPLVHGSGLGIWFAYWIVRSHDGTITATVGDEGTDLTVTLPRTVRPELVEDPQRLLRLFYRERDRFEAVFEESLDGIVIADGEGTILDANDPAGTLFGVPAEALPGRTIREFLPPSVPFESRWESFLQRGQDEDTLPIERPDGTTRSAEYAAVANIIPGQHLAILRDVTDREEQQEELRLRNRVIEEAPIGVTLSDPSRPDNPLVYVNDAFERITGYETSEILGENCRILQGPETDTETVARMRDGIDAAEPVTVTVRNYRRDGSPFWNRVTIAPIRDETGDIVRFVGFQEDVTDAVSQN